MWGAGPEAESWQQSPTGAVPSFWPGYCLFSRVYTFHCEISHCEIFAAVQSLSHVQLCNPMDRSTPGFPLSHYVSEFEQTHVH